MHAQPEPHISEAAYLELERSSATRHEYYAGRVYAMTGASEQHNLIASNVNASLHAQVRGRCRVYPSDMRVKVLRSGLNTYPDISVVCGSPQLADAARRDTLTNPALIVKILSPSTERYDRGMKFQHYRLIESLREYVLIAQDAPLIERYARGADGQWVLSEASGLDAQVALESIGAVLRLADVYEQVELPPGAPAIPREPPADG